MNKHITRVTAALLAAAMTVPLTINAATLTDPAPAKTTVELCGESEFTYKSAPWQACATSPAKQNFRIEDGEFHIRILTARGTDDYWDLQFRHGKLNFKKDHTYKVSFRAKASRNGLKMNSHIGDIGQPYHEYCTLTNDGFVNGPHMDNGKWGETVELTTEWQTFEGTFHCTEDLRSKEWTFQYAAGEKGNAQDGDEIWFDDMHINCLTCEELGTNDCGYTSPPFYLTERAASGLYGNYISVNQIGYLAAYEKIAVLGDNASNHNPYGGKLELTKDIYEYELVEESTGKVAYTGKTGKKMSDPDSGDAVCKIDFTAFKTPGRYFLRIKGEDWRSFAFDISNDIYSASGHDLLTNAVNYFYQNRSGQDILEDCITSGDKSGLAHAGSDADTTAIVQKIWKDEYQSASEASSTYASSTIKANGGWYEAADHSKSVVSGGMALWTLQNMYERAATKATGKQKFADKSGTVVVPESGNKVPDVLDECAYELAFMEKMVVQEDEPTWGQYAGLVYSKVQDQKRTGLAVRAWDYVEQWDTVRIVKPPTFAATLNYAACAAQAARLWKDYDAKKAAGYLDAAKKAYAAFKKYYYEADLKKIRHPYLDVSCPAEELNEVSLYAPMWQAKTSDPYGDFDVTDDAYWAACELFLSAAELEDADAAKYLKDLSDYDKAFTVPDKINGGENLDGEGSYTAFNWGNTAAAGSLDLMLHAERLTAEQRKKLNDSVIQTADSYAETAQKQGYGVPYRNDDKGYNDPMDGFLYIHGYEFGSNGSAMNNMIVMAYAYGLTGEAKYLNGVQSGMNYLLGCNPLSFSFISGYGSYKLRNPNHKYWAYEMDSNFPMAPDGVIAGGPSVYCLGDPTMLSLGFDPQVKDNPSQRFYVDDVEAWSTNAVSLDWNASLAWLADFMQDPGTPVPPPVTTTTTAETQTTTTQTTTTLVTTTGMRPPTDWGNIDGSDGSTPEARIDVSDAVLLARFLSGDSSAKITDSGKENANVIKGELDENDLTAILMFIVKKISFDQFPLDKLPS